MAFKRFAVPQRGPRSLQKISQRARQVLLGKVRQLHFFRLEVPAGKYAYQHARSACEACPMKHRCCPNSIRRKVTRSIHEPARNVARALAETEAFEETRRHRKKVEMAFAHLKRILRMSRLRLRGPTGAQDEFTLAAIAQNLRKMARLMQSPQMA